MFKRLLFTIPLLVCFGAQASYLERCQYKVNLVEIHQGVQKLGQSINTSGIKIAAFEIEQLLSSAGSHHPGACKDRIGKLQLLEVQSNFQASPGTELVLEYMHVSGRSPNGVSQSNSWRIISDTPNSVY